MGAHEASEHLAMAARDLLELRLGAVDVLVPKAARARGSEPEKVHQLRVATRRAEAALTVFAGCVKKVHRQKLEKRLGRLRTAAGLVRVCDVDLVLFRNALGAAEPSDRAAI